ncbi:MAG TPA: response regulator [Pseudolabrys sp.]|nr:response regulator [Pseudolabrys sp.]
MAQEKVNILLVDDQPAKLLSYEAILHGLNENLLKATSGREALEHLLKSDVAVVLVDVCMPDLDGFQLAAMIREHPRFQKTAIIFISAIHLSEMDRLRGYEMGAVDYVPVPVIPEVLQAKVRVFSDLYRKTRELERLNLELERRVAERTSELVASNARLLESEQRRSLALAAGQMGSWDWDLVNGDWMWDEGHCRIFGVDHATFRPSLHNLSAFVDPADMRRLQIMIADFKRGGSRAYQTEFRVMRADGAVRWCFGTAAPTISDEGEVLRISGVTIDITDRKEAEERQALLAREVDHRAKNALALVQSIVRLTRAKTLPTYIDAVEGRIKALSSAHTVLSHSRWQGASLTSLINEEFAPYRTGDAGRIRLEGPEFLLQPSAAQTLALALHELATNAAKYGALSALKGCVSLTWDVNDGDLVMRWSERGGPPAMKPATAGFGTRIILASIEQQLSGKAKFEWSREGLNCELSVPLAQKIEQAERAALVRPVADSHAGIGLAGDCVLLVEDEALVALAVSELLTELGFTVLGPYSRVSDAAAAMRERRIDAAILDINLGGELVYPLAEMLEQRGVPFVYVTGYGAESVDPRFEKVPVLQKPIERDVLRRIFVRKGNGAGATGGVVANGAIANGPAANGAVANGTAANGASGEAATGWAAPVSGEATATPRPMRAVN